jgi:gamma-D-glutamyl-L-lysine dipeptidyl-peptidase
MKHAFVATNLLDLWSEPRYNSERASQLLFGEVVSTGAVRKGFVRIVQPDGYVGWVDRRFIREVPKTPTTAYRKAAEFVVMREKMKIVGTSGQATVSPHFLYYGTRVRILTRDESGRVGVLPDGTQFRASANALTRITKSKDNKVVGSDLVREARRFLGVPYLWGGISPAGFDCSGLVRTVLSRYGIYVPRDTKDQIKAGRPIERTAVQTGDLLFFKRHVGLAIGRDRLIHASMGGSGVRINSLRPGSDDYRPDLDRDFATARRIL